MRRIGMVGLALALALGCYREPAPQPHQGYAHSPGYYPPPQPPTYYPPQQPTYYPPQYPPQPQPTSPPPPQQPPPQPPPGAGQPANPLMTFLGQLLAGAPPLPPGWGPSPTPTTPPPPPPGTPPLPGINARGLELAHAINRYRMQNGLLPIPISKSLSHVADTHVRDLRDSPKVAPTCNGHSWSTRGSWTPCCYTADHAQAKCMWQKPAELTSFKATGFEIAIGQPGELQAGVALDSQKAVTSWQGSALHNDVILNRNTWQKTTWRAMGAGIVDSHACAWFSDQPDPVQ